MTGPHVWREILGLKGMDTHTHTHTQDVYKRQLFIDISFSILQWINMTLFSGQGCVASDFSSYRQEGTENVCHSQPL